MKKLLIVVILMFTCFANSQKKDSIIILKTDVAREVIKDLIKGDYCLEELKTTKTLVFQLEKKVELKNEFINSLQKENYLQKELTDSKVEQIDILKKELSNVKLKKTGGKILLYGSIAINLFLLTKL